jgi:hypothetical protein
MRVRALVPDMMDRARLSAAIPDVEFVRDAADCADAEIVVVDLARCGNDVEAVRASAPTARVVAFGPHVDGARFDAARADGADVVIPRSRFFRDIAAALA